VETGSLGWRSDRRWSWAFTLLLLALLIGALALRLARLDFQPLWWDEGYSVWFATQAPAEAIALTAADIHPPLYYLLLGGWIRLFGPAPLALRALSVAFAVASVALMFVTGTRLLGTRRSGMLAALLLAISPLHVYYSQEVRMYGLVALLAIGVLLAGWTAFATRGRPPKWRVLASYVALGAAALYTQYYAAFLLVGLALYGFWRWRSNLRSLVRWLVAQSVLLLLYLPWLLYAAPKLVPYVGQKIVQDADRPLGPLAYLGRHLSAFTGGHLEGPLAPLWPWALLLLIPIAIGLVLALRRDPAPNGASPVAIAMLLTALGVALGLGFLVGLRFPFFPERGERLLLFALPAFLLLVAAALEALWRRSHVGAGLTLGLMVLVSAASLTAFYATPRYLADDYRPLIARIAEQGRPGDTVFAVYPWQAGYWRSYADPAGASVLLSPGAAWGNEVASALDTGLAHGRVWFPAHLSLGGVLESQIERHLRERALPFANTWYGPGTRLSAWAMLPDSQPVPTPPVRFEGSGVKVSLAGLEMGASEVSSGSGILPLTLIWDSENSPPPLVVSVRLVDALDQIWAQHDYEPLGGPNAEPAGDGTARWRAADRLGLLVPAGVPPGEYHLELVVQPRNGKRPLTATVNGGATPGEAGRISALRVTDSEVPLGPGALPIAHRQQVAVGDEIEFLGHAADGAPLAPGDLRKVGLFWQASAAPQEDVVAFLQLLDRSGGVLAGWEAPPGAGFPTHLWKPGTLVRTQASLRVPAGTPDGRYRLIAGLYRANDRSRLATAAGASHLALGLVEVLGRPHDMTPPRAVHPAEAAFGGAARLVGYELATGGSLTAEEQPLAGGDALDVTLHWQALGSSERPLTVFVHLVDADGEVVGYGDGEPGQGAFPTTGWLAGEYLADTHTIAIPPGAPPGAYRLEVGLYDPATGARLATGDGADSLLLGAAVRIGP
jgi:4-amino-4-deoxy-L-arabinose transferase-like glycosyltransferase